MALASFGGLGITGLPLEPLARLDGWSVVTTAHALDAVGPVPAGVRVLEDAAVYAAGLRYEDLVRAADVVVTKPGYGIIAECIANDSAILYTDRGRFAEYDVLVEAMPKYLRARYMPRDGSLPGPVASTTSTPCSPRRRRPNAPAPTAPSSPPATSSPPPERGLAPVRLGSQWARRRQVSTSAGGTFRTTSWDVGSQASRALS